MHIFVRCPNLIVSTTIPKIPSLKFLSKCTAWSEAAVRLAVNYQIPFKTYRVILSDIDQALPGLAPRRHPSDSIPSLWCQFVDDPGSG